MKIEILISLFDEKTAYGSHNLLFEVTLMNQIRPKKYGNGNNTLGFLFHNNENQNR